MTSRSVLVLVVLGALGMSLPLQGEPPAKLTPEQRKELEAKWKELNKGIGQAYGKGQLSEATKAAAGRRWQWPRICTPRKSIRTVIKVWL